MATKKTTKTTLVAEICLYGNRETGAGWLARTMDGRMFGDGEPRSGRSNTEAVWLAVDDLRAAGVTLGMVRIFAPGGQMMATTAIHEHVPNFGSLKWTYETIVYEIPAEAIIAAAEAQARQS